MPENPFVAFFRTLSNPGVPGELWTQLRPWMQRLALNIPKNALPRDPPECCAHVTRSGNDCGALGVLECRACGDLVCLEHGYVNTYAHAICCQCVSAVTSAAREEERAAEREEQENAKRGRGKKKKRTWTDNAPSGRRRPPPPQSPEEEEEFERRAALQTLGLEQNATQTQIHERFRELSKELHPDKVTDPKKKAQATARYKKITEAYHVLKSAEAA